MKIIHFLNELKFSGAEIMYVDAATEFKKLGGGTLAAVNTAEALGEYAPYFEQAGYKVYHLPYPKSIIQRWKYYNKVVSILKREHYDVVHIHSSGLKWGMSYCAWRAGCKSVYTFHNVFRSHWYSYPYHRWLRWSAKHIFGCVFHTISDSVYDNEKKYYHNNTIKIYNWYGCNRFSPASATEKYEIRRKLDIPEGSLVLISIGGCSPIKRHTDIIKALPKIIREYPDTIYLHLGEGNMLEAEQKLAQNLNVHSHIRFLGNKPDVRKFLVASDIYLMPSKHEGIPITTIEAMACKIPTILYDVPGLCDFNKTANCSILIQEDPDLLAENTVTLFRNKKLQSEITENAKKLVDSMFYMPTNAAKIFELYRKK